MADVRYCTAGRNDQGQWHIACAEPAAQGAKILMNMRYTNQMSSPQEKTYEFAAKHICRSGGRKWTTNALNEKTNCSDMFF